MKLETPSQLIGLYFASNLGVKERPPTIYPKIFKKRQNLFQTDNVCILESEGMIVYLGRLDPGEEGSWNDDENQPIISCPVCDVKWFNGWDTADCAHLLFRWCSDDGFVPCGDWDIESFTDIYRKAYLKSHHDIEKEDFSIDLYFDLDVIHDMNVNGIEIILYQDSDGLPMGGRPPIFLYGYKDVDIPD